MDKKELKRILNYAKIRGMMSCNVNEVLQEYIKDYANKPFASILDYSWDDLPW